MFYEVFEALLEAHGGRIVYSPTTEDALEKLQSGTFDAVISDMGRISDQQAGYTLLAEIRKFGLATPYIIYSTSDRREHQAEARGKGAIGSTSRPEELFALVLEAVAATRTQGR